MMLKPMSASPPITIPVSINRRAPNLSMIQPAKNPNMGPITSLPTALPDVMIDRDQPNSFIQKSKKNGNP